MEEILSVIGQLIVMFFKFIINSFKGLPHSWPYAVISLACIFFMAFGLYIVIYFLYSVVTGIIDTFKNARKNRIEKKELKEIKERENRKTPQQKFEEAVKNYSGKRYYYSEQEYYSFVPFLDKVDGAREYAEKSLHNWYEYVAGEADKYLRDRNRSSNTGLRYHKQLENIMHEIYVHDYLAGWAKDLVRTAERLEEAIGGALASEAEDEARERREEAAALQMRMEEEYGDSYDSAPEAYDYVDLSVLPGFLFFTNIPNVVYHHIGYMTGGLGQRVRVYESLDGSKRISFSTVNTGFYNDGRTFSTDLGTVEKYL